jgi:Zn-dependent protease with chaperone function
MIRPGALIVSVVFKTLAIVTLITGFVVASYAQQIAASNGLSSGQQTDLAFGAIVSGIVLACWFAFFGYVLSLLRNIANAADDHALHPPHRADHRQERSN